MKINFDTTLTDFDGTPIKQVDKDLTLGAACISALLAPYPDDNTASAEEKIKRYKLASKVHDGGEQDISVDDASFLKKMISKAWSTLVVGCAFELLDPAPSDQAGVAGSGGKAKNLKAV